MTVNRLHGKPGFIEAIREISTENEAQKQAQIIGADVLLTFFEHSGNIWDWVGRVDTISGEKEFTVTFTPDVESAGLKVCARCVVEGGGIYDSVSVRVRRVRIANAKSQKWSVKLTYYGDKPIRAKFYVSATGRGTVSVV